MSRDPRTPSSVKSRLAAELKNYALISGYLYACFFVILLYESSLVPDAQTTLLAHGLALGKALVIGKFILVGEALNAGNRLRAPTLLHRVGYRTIGMLVVLLLLKLLEELILGWVHGKSATAVLAEVLDKPWVGIVAPILLMMLILVPLITATELNRAMAGQLREKLLATKQD